MRHLLAIDRRLGVLDRRIRLLSRLNPLNTQNEKRKFLYAWSKGRMYNPSFRYKQAPHKICQTEGELQDLSIPIPIVYEKNEGWFFAKHLARKRLRLMRKVQAIKRVGTPEFSVQAQALFGKPSAYQISYAENQIQKREGGESPFTLMKDTLSAGDAAEMLQKYIDAHLLPWRVKIRKNISSKAGLDARSKYLLVRSGEWFSSEEIHCLSMHEIETHIFRRENGLLQKFPALFGEGFAGPPSTEEGLAFFNETQSPRHDPRRIIIVCGRAIAADLARTKSFYEVFCELNARGIPPQFSWVITLRVKRGFSDTSMPGSFTKDHHYLRGYLDIKTFLDRGGDLRALYVGKLNTSILSSLSGFDVATKSPRYLPSYLKQ